MCPTAKRRGLLPPNNTNGSTETAERRAPGSTAAFRTLRSRDSRSPGIITGSLLALCALLALVAAADRWLNVGKIYEGVSAGSVALGGMTPEEAREVLEKRASTTLGSIRLTGSRGASELDLEPMDVTFDAAGTVELAYAVGRGGLVEGLRGRAAAALGVAKVEPSVEYRPERTYAVADGLAARVDRQPRPASVAVRGTKVEVSESRTGYRVDVPATAGNIQRAVKELTGKAKIVGDVLEPETDTSAAEEAAAKARRAMAQQAILKSAEGRWTLSPAEIGSALEITPRGEALSVSLDREALSASLGDMYADLTVEPIEAGYRFSGGDVAVIPSREGRSVEEEKLLDALERGLLQGRREYEVPVSTYEPELTTAMAEKNKPTERLGSYRTDYSLVSDTNARVENLKISSRAVDGTLLGPGEVFSMNDTVSSLDYRKTKVIVDGRETKADGGGLCQVTSTLYNAVNEAGLDVTERHPHYAQLPYIRPGLDATVWFGDERGDGALDMKFENTTDSYVILREWVAEDGYVHAEVWGQPHDTQVRTWSKRVYVGEDFSRWITYQTYEKAGKVVYDGVLHKDTYKPLIDEHGRKIPPRDVPVAPVEP
jgi:vancomycin resistance protein YoaR